MANEVIDTTNKLIKPEDISPSDDETIRQLSENLQDVTPEDVSAMCDGIDETGKIKEENLGREIEKDKIEDDDEEEEEDPGFEIICKVGGRNVAHNKSKGIVTWRGKTYDVHTFQGGRMLLSDIQDSGKLTAEVMIKISIAIGI